MITAQTLSSDHQNASLRESRRAETTSAAQLQEG